MRYNHKLGLDKYYDLLKELEYEGRMRLLHIDGTGKVRGTDIWCIIH
ncbi:hypothetical protein LGK95_21935 [Clostridium algoriphilum]|nr:hypothetical protein [Clostridium algoriphilum]MCB2296112.1 hypothetical protein [Clostridium algoriphilum]